MGRAVPFLLAVAAIRCLGQDNNKPEPPPPPWQPALARIQADSLRGHLSFLASDLLEGRDTPSRGLEIAAHYIAAQFRRAGLEPAGDDGYFQTATFDMREPDLEGFELSFSGGDVSVRVAPDQASLFNTSGGELAGAIALRIRPELGSPLGGVTREQAQGKVLLVDFGPPSETRPLIRSVLSVTGAASRLQPALVILLDRGWGLARLMPRARLIDREGPPPPQTASTVVVRDPAVAKLLDSLPAEGASLTVSARWKAPVPRPVTLRNVAGLVRGSDAALKETAVVLSAHYDHTGMLASGEGDRIFNGANDNASGAATVVELASAIASLEHKPRRSVLFLAFFGEERGLLGSRFYVRHPLVPMAKTIANLNIEQVGRTDSSEGPQLASASLTGFDYSDIGRVFAAAGERTGIRVYRHEKNNDTYFSRSDNISFARLGVPAHTLTTAYQYADYHQPGDHWEKIDCENMERVLRMIALGVLMLADSVEAPRWNETLPKTEPFRKARD